MSVTEQTRPNAATPLRHARMLIAGAWVDSASGEALVWRIPARAEDRRDPARGCGRCGSGCAGRRRRRSLPGARSPPRDRGRLLLRIAEALEARGEELARHHRAGDRQCAAHPGAAAKRRLSADIFRYFGGLGRRTERRDDPARRACAQLHATRAARRRRRHHPVERAGAAGRAEDRAGVVRRQHAGAEGGRGCPARRAADGRVCQRVPAARRAQRADRARRGMRRARWRSTR